jgi:hypothetical protein
MATGLGRHARQRGTRTDRWTLRCAAGGKSGRGTWHEGPARGSGARPSCFPAGQPSVDRDSLQKVELCDKNARYESCRWDIPLQHLQRLSYVFLNGLSRNAKQSSSFAEHWWIVKTAVDQAFHPFPLKIWNVIQHESCALEKMDIFYIGRIWSV